MIGFMGMGSRSCLSMVIFALSAAAGFALPAYATSFNERPFPETVHDAPVIVRGKVGSSYSDWAKLDDGSKRIYTFYELQIDEVFKGGVSGKSLTMRELGGEKNGVGLQVAGSAQFNRGEDVVVMLGSQNSDSSYDVWGLMMGKYDLRTGDDGKEYLVGAGIESQGDTPAHGRWTLDRLRSLVRNEGGDTHPKTGPSPVAGLAPSPHSSTAPVAPSVRPSEQAPQLQPSSSQEPEGSSNSGSQAGIWIGVGFLALLVGAFIVFKAMKR